MTMEGIRNAVAAVLAAATLPGTLELLLTTAGNLAPGRRRRGTTGAHAFRLAVLIPAHNEERAIGRSVRSALAACASCPGAEVIVIADNCSDATAQAARQTGVRVIERREPLRRGKAQALADTLHALEDEAFEGYFILDADSEISPNSIAAVAGRLAAGADAVQCRNLVLNAEESPRTRLMALALYAFNVVRPRGRAGWGLSAGPFGNGFALSRRALAIAPYRAATIVEDLEYHLALVMAEGRAEFADDATVWSTVPATAAGATPQRCRWEGGRFRVARQWTPRLVQHVLRGRWRLVEPLLALLTLPLGFHVPLLLALLVVAGGAAARGLALLGLAVVAAHVAAACLVSDKPAAAIRSLAAAPWYVLWKLKVLPGVLRASRANAGWAEPHTGC